MTWITWQGVGVDRMACGWVIRRFIDETAVFEFIPEGSTPAGAAESFDIPGVRLSHHQGHSSVHTIMLEYGLTSPELTRIAQMVDEADLVQEFSLEPAAFGLDLICRGIRRTSGNDALALERSALVFEALYAELLYEGVNP